jgi:hypothetical protein
LLVNGTNFSQQTMINEKGRKDQLQNFRWKETLIHHAISVLRTAQPPMPYELENCEAKGGGALLCVWNESYGLIYQGVEENLKGLCIDILSDFVTFLQARYNVNVSLEFAEEKNVDEFLNRIQKTPNALGVSNVTEDRKRVFQFSPVYLTSPQ